MVKVTTMEATDEAVTMDAVRLDPHWNGNAVPVTTAAAFRAYVSRMAQVDPNGGWSGLTIDTGHEGLVLTARRAYEDIDEGDFWDAVGVADTGETLYALDGWCWAVIPEDVTLTLPRHVLTYLSDLIDIDDDADESWRPMSTREAAARVIGTALEGK